MKNLNEIKKDSIDEINAEKEREVRNRVVGLIRDIHSLTRQLQDKKQALKEIGLPEEIKESLLD